MAINTAETPQAITGTVILTNPSIQTLPALTPETAGASLAVVLGFVLLWPWVVDNVRYVSPQYVQGWFLLAIGLLVWGPFRALVKGWRR